LVFNEGQKVTSFAPIAQRVREEHVVAVSMKALQEEHMPGCERVTAGRAKSIEGWLGEQGLAFSPARLPSLGNVLVIVYSKELADVRDALALQGEWAVPHKAATLLRVVGQQMFT
jgi:hypothetical protein